MAGERNLWQNSFNMCIDPLVIYPSFYFLDIDDLTSSVPLKTGVMNGFKLDLRQACRRQLAGLLGRKGCQCPRQHLAPGSTSAWADRQRRRTDLLYPLRRL
ncbi:MAG: hypothetical protein MZV63_56105 [Marinilabiliales bacterium]|nr:hypothetical protein [Marinilabiliales bacterium]